jgi:hypothetical protein
MILIEGKDIASTYNDIVVPENAGLGTSASGIGVGTINMTATTQFSAQSVTNTNLQAYLDYYGTLAVKNSASSSQPTLVLYYPPTQIYDQLYLGPTSSTVTTTVAGGLNANGQAIQLGSAVVKDSAISSVAQNNLIVVGGSCINSAAAQLLGVPTGTCGPAFTSATGIGSGQFLVQSFNSTFDLPTGTAIALLVAGYDVSDTVAATTWLTMQKPDTSLGRQYSGTSSTSTAITVH